LKKNVIEKRENGYTLSYATYTDIKKIQKLVDDLPKETKRLFNPWLFVKNPSFKVKIARLGSRISLLPGFKKIIKLIFPLSYIVIIKLESPKSEIIGYLAITLFRRYTNGTFIAQPGGAIAEKYQNKGLGSWIRAVRDEVAKKENVKILRGGTPATNKKIIKINVEKLGWKITGIKKVISQYDGTEYEEVQLEKELELIKE